MKHVLKTLVLAGAVAIVLAPVQARADGWIAPWLGSSFGSNIDISNECGPQSETFITINPANTRQLAAGSNEIFRLPMRGYFSSKGGHAGPIFSMIVRTYR